MRAGKANPSPVVVRRLGPGEARLVHQLNDLFAVAFADEITYHAARPRDAYLETMLSKPHVIPVVALVDERIVGGLVAYVLDKLEQARCEVYIYDLAVDAGHRRRGVATALVSHLRQLVGGIGACMIFVQADLGDTPAIALYTKLGRREDVLHFDIDVPAPNRA